MFCSDQFYSGFPRTYDMLHINKSATLDKKKVLLGLPYFSHRKKIKNRVNLPTQNDVSYNLFLNNREYSTRAREYFFCNFGKLFTSHTLKRSWFELKMQF
jgi:hypothetical protein